MLFLLLADNCSRQSLLSLPCCQSPDFIPKGVVRWACPSLVQTGILFRDSKFHICWKQSHSVQCWSMTRDSAEGASGKVSKPIRKTWSIFFYWPLLCTHCSTLNSYLVSSQKKNKKKPKKLLTGRAGTQRHTARILPVTGFLPHTVTNAFIVQAAGLSFFSIQPHGTLTDG